MNQIWEKFWAWYQRHYLANLAVAAFLFLLQLFHLYWLLTDVVLARIYGESFFGLSEIWGLVSTMIDYLEIPAIISTSILYIHLLRQKFSNKNFLYLLFINIQWLHLFWITDEVVIAHFRPSLELLHWSALLAWLAIVIDYLELPVIWDTAKRLLFEIKNQRSKIKI